MSYNLGALYKEQEDQKREQARLARDQAALDREHKAQAKVDDERRRHQEELVERAKCQEWITKRCGEVITSIRTDIDNKSIQPSYDINYGMRDPCDMLYVATTKEKLAENGISGFKVCTVGISNVCDVAAVRIEPNS